METLILHHYWGSPFAEKIRSILGYKDAEWQSLEVSPVPPRPSLDPVLGTFRRTPVLQLGRDFFCDSRLIAEVIDEALPERPLSRPSHRALSDLITGWAEPRAFVMTGPLRFGAVEDVEGVFDGAVSAQDFQRDRVPFMAPAIDAGRFPLLRASAEDHVRAYLGIVEELLRDGPAFLCGDSPGFADFSYHHLVWWLLRPPARGDLLRAFPRTTEAAQRIRTFGHGTYVAVTPADARAALEKAQHTPAWKPWQGGSEDPRSGTSVTVRPDDYGKQPLLGRLVGSSTRHVSLEVPVDGVGTARVHFPRLGYEVTAAS